MMEGLAADHGEEKTVMIDATYPKANRTVTSMSVNKGIAAMTPPGSQKRCATKGYARVSPVECSAGKL